mmetsp:Transcript_6767/g.18159  ORF Transcript_6767/g.18159 Transcript_6767/m.18159 type:complete len:480 (-) Transcript_6767:609-2048(-)
MSESHERLSHFLGKARSRKVKLLLLFTFQTLFMLYGWFGLSRSPPGSPPGPVEVTAHDHVHAIEAHTPQELQELVARRHPINRLQCGKWVTEYAALHRAILAGKAPQRYAIMRSKQEFGNGLADRLASSVSILLFAILTDRAFLYDWDPPPPPPGIPIHEGCGGPQQKYRPSTPLWSALRSDFINWTYEHSRSPEAGNSTLLMDYVCDKGMDEYRAMFASQDLTAVGEGFHSVVWYTDHAGVYSAFNNPYLQPALAALGLQQDIAFACLFDFLYRPVPEVVNMFRPELQILLDPSVFKIGLQIRVGDWQLVSASSYFFRPQNFPSLFHHYFQCAEEIEGSLAQPGQRVVWFVLTDVLSLRQRLKDRYGPRILTNTTVVVEHTVKSDVRSDSPFLQAAGELWLFSLTDHHILTRTSGFGKVGAMLSAAGPSHIYQVFQPMNFFNLVALSNRKQVMWWHSRKCTPEFADPLLELCTDFTGI